MRIAYICADAGVPVFGSKGCSVHVQELVGAFTRRCATVELFARRFDGEPPATWGAVRVHHLPALPKGDVAAREQAALAANPSLRRALEREGPFDLVYERYSLWSVAGLEYARAHDTSALLEVNAPLIDEQQQYRDLADRASAEQVAERAFAAASALVAVSAEIAAYLAERYPLTRRRVHVIPNAVNCDRFAADLTPSYPGRAGTFTVGFVGTLKPWHGLSVLVDAFARLHHRDPNTRLLLVGDGPERPSLVADLAARGLLSAAHFTGAVSPHAVPGLLASMDVGVAPYPQEANFYFSPLKVYEYMGAGLPIVTSCIGQLRELIKDGITGLLCPPGDAIALAAALERLRCDPELRRRLGSAARTAALREHTWDEVARRVVDLAGASRAELQREWTMNS